jgi:hypothetical protein
MTSCSAERPVMTVISVVCTSFGPGLWVVLGLPSRRDRDGRMTREDFSIDYPGKVRKGFDSGGALGGLRLCMPDEQRGERQGEKKNSWTRRFRHGLSSATSSHHSRIDDRRRATGCSKSSTRKTDEI